MLSKNGVIALWFFIITCVVIIAWATFQYIERIGPSSSKTTFKTSTACNQTENNLTISMNNDSTENVIGSEADKEKNKKLDGTASSIKKSESKLKKSGVVKKDTATSSVSAIDAHEEIQSKEDGFYKKNEFPSNIINSTVDIGKGGCRITKNNPISTASSSTRRSNSIGIQKNPSTGYYDLSSSDSDEPQSNPPIPRRKKNDTNTSTYTMYVEKGVCKDHKFVGIGHFCTPKCNHNVGRGKYGYDTK
ncbi:hypothetical protein NEPAR04_0156 [Nematocida parisii]|nr:hypothetical protein NEPAR03_0150 [Nematocida parisii]KAI5125756.1 hypothetical protein NEPAR08_0194 [Nematocida parisii]KAI5140211.1 hypothetical protein NEPAR04_0156 [Nematocida parisii]